MKKICLTLTALALLLLLAGCAVRDNEKKDSYIIIHSIASDTDTKVTPEDKNYDALLDSLFDAASEAVGTTTVLSGDAVQTGTITYYQAPTRTVLGSGNDAAYTPILALDLYDDGGDSYAEGYFCSDETKTLKFCFPVPAQLILSVLKHSLRIGRKKCTRTLRLKIFSISTSAAMLHLLS